MRKIILFVDSSLFGGIESHIIELVKLLKANNQHVCVLFVKDHGNTQLCNALDLQNCQYEFLNGGVGALLKFLKNNPDIVLHTHGYKAGIIGRISCKLSNIPCVSTYHAGETGVGRIKLYNWLDQATSSLSKNIIVSTKLKNKVSNGQFMANFISPNNPLKLFNNEALNIAFVGRLSHEKGPDRFIELAKSFLDNHKFKFHVYGSGLLEAELKHNASSNVTFHGHQADKSYWQHIDVLVVCSREEGLPMVLLEAIDNKIICVCNRVGAIDTVIKHNFNGFINDNQSLDCLINSLKRLEFLSVKEREFLAKNAYSHLIRYFSGKQQIAQLQSLYYED